MKKIFSGVICLVLLSGVSICHAEEVYQLTIKDHEFSPKVLTIPSGKKVKLVVENKDVSAEEFESYDLNREKVVGGNSKITVFIGPLKRGVYKFFGEFHPQTAKGEIKVE